MRLKDRVRPKIPPLETGVYYAVCSIVCDLGHQYSDYYKSVKEKLMISFDIPGETVEIDGKMEPRQVSAWLTASTSSSSNLYKLLSPWLGLDEDGLREFELFDLVGRGCQVQLRAVKESGRNEIGAVMGLPRGTEAPKTSNPLITYDIYEDGFEGARWESLPEWLRGIIKKSEEYKEYAPDQPLDMPAENAPEEPELAEKKRCPI